MYIERVEIANFRGLVTKDSEGREQPYTELNFDRAFNVIIGVNGIGKTSILDMLAILLGRMLPHIVPASTRKRSFIATDFRVADAEVVGRIWLDFDTDTVTYGVAQTVDLQRKPLEDIDKRLIATLAGRYEKGKPLAPVNTPVALLYTTERAGYRLARKIVTMAPPGRAAAFQGALVEKTVNYGLVAQWLYKHRSLANESDRDRRILEATETALQRFLPAFGELEEQIDPPRLFVKKRGVRLGIEQLSDGERSFLAIVVDIARHLAQANPGTDNPLATGEGVVLIDELELHLHPRWQRGVVERLQATFPGVQFITTTHSPFVIQSLRAGQLINLDPESFVEEYADKSIDDITEGIMGVEMPQKSERYLVMMATAKEYYRTLAQAEEASGAALEQLKTHLDELTIPYSDDAAFTAFLKFQRESALQEDATSNQRERPS